MPKAYHTDHQQNLDMIVTIISGASRGIGNAIAEDLKNLDHVFIRLSSKNVNFEHYNDVYDGTKSLIDCFSGIKQINAILCAAQVGTANVFSLEECDKLYKINMLGNLAIIQAIMEYNVKMRIVFFAGGGAAFPNPEFFGYGLSKVAVVRAVENLSLGMDKDSSIIALSPGAVDTDMLKIVLDAGVHVRTKTDISEPVNFVRKFILDELDGIDSIALNGCFLHVRDNIDRISTKKDMFKLRRIE